MQSAVPVGKGGMLAVLGIEADEIQKLINENFEYFKCYLANDNSKGQLIISGKNTDLEKFAILLKENGLHIRERQWFSIGNGSSRALISLLPTVH